MEALNGPETKVLKSTYDELEARLSNLQEENELQMQMMQGLRDWNGRILPNREVLEENISLKK